MTIKQYFYTRNLAITNRLRASCAHSNNNKFAGG